MYYDCFVNCRRVDELREMNRGDVDAYKSKWNDTPR